MLLDLVKNGPFGVVINGDENDFPFYKKGVYSGCKNPLAPPTHAVLVVG